MTATVAVPALPEAEIGRLQRLDETLFRSFEKRGNRELFLHAMASGPRNARLKTFLQGKLPATPEGHAALASYLEKSGAFNLTPERRVWRDVDGESRMVTLTRAALTPMWPMGTNVWMRDNALIADRLLRGTTSKLPSVRRRAGVGKRIMTSMLTLSSSATQLLRMETVVMTPAMAENPHHWPHIFLLIKDNLNAARVERWAHKQDAFQMVAVLAFDALSRGQLKPADFTDKHKRFLGLLLPFLIAVDHTRTPNSGSWEELEALRTSVLAWNLAVLDRLEIALQGPLNHAINAGWEEFRGALPASYRTLDLPAAIKKEMRKTALVLERLLPDEMPEYPKKDPRRRSADAALHYLLQLGTVPLVMRVLKKDVPWGRRKGLKLLKHIDELSDARTGGIHRFRDDFYQMQGFFRHLTVAKLKALYGSVSGDASGMADYVGRKEIMREGRMAAWTHFVWQHAAWAGRRALDTRDPKMRVLHDRMFWRGLCLLTGEGEVSLEETEHGRMRVIRVPPMRMPECYISDALPDGTVVTFPTPHTPLNWSVGEMLDAFAVREELLLRDKAERTATKNT